MMKLEVADVKKQVDEFFEKVHSGDKEAIEKLIRIKKEMGGN